MGHHGKHIIDPDTGLCEICDKDAIYDIRQGKRPEKHIYYSNHDDNYISDLNNHNRHNNQDQYGYGIDDDREPHFTRRRIYHAPPVRPRRAIYEEPVDQPILIRRKIVQPSHTGPPEEVIVRRQPKRYYYVDEEGQMFPQDRTPTPEPPRRYVVQSRHHPTTSSPEIPWRRTQTPLSSMDDNRHPRPRREINSDTNIFDRHHRTQHDQTDHREHEPPALVEMYHIEAQPDDNHHPTMHSPVHSPGDRNITSPNFLRRGEQIRRQRRVEPMESQNHSQGAHPTVVRKVYKKAPPGKSSQYDDRLPTNGRINHPPKQYSSSYFN